MADKQTGQAKFGDLEGEATDFGKSKANRHQSRSQ
jgi:hypothetical protein